MSNIPDLRSFEFKDDDLLWFSLDDVLNALELTTADIKILEDDFFNEE